MTLPKLENWNATAHGLHHATMLLGIVRVLLVEHQNNYLELGLKILPQGLSTDVLPTGGEVILDFKNTNLSYRSANGEGVQWSLLEHTQAELFDALAAAMENEIADAIKDHMGGALIDRIHAAASANATLTPPTKEELTQSEPLNIDATVAGQYADALYTVFTDVARFRARLVGMMTPIVVWPEHFDLSFLWFKGEDDDSKPHLNFGFSPFSDNIERPYLYVYAYPYPEKYDVPSLPEGARWETQDYTGVFLSYDELVQRPAGYTEEACTAIFKSLRPLLGS